MWPLEVRTAGGRSCKTEAPSTDAEGERQPERSGALGCVVMALREMAPVEPVAHERRRSGNGRSG